MDFELNLNNDFRSSTGTDPLPTTNLVPREGLAAPPRNIVVWDHTEYLRVDQTASQRAGAKVSKIWDHGFELRALPGLEKYWQCKHCPRHRPFKVGRGNNSAAQRHSFTRPSSDVLRKCFAGYSGPYLES